MSKTVVIKTSGNLHFLTLLFIGLKLTGYIHWAWGWVLLPSYGPLVCILFVLVMAAIGVALFGSRR